MEVDVTKPFSIRRDVLFEGAFYTEGPVCDRNGGVYFTDLTGGTVWHWQPMKGATRCVTGGWPNGQTGDAAGGWRVCDSQNGQVKYYDAEWHFESNLIDGTCAGKPVRTPNDVIVDVEGGLYVTDSVRYEGRVFYRSASGQERVVAEGMDYPNGLVLSADGQRLFVAESYANRLVCIHLEAPGVATRREVFGSLPHHPSGREVDNLPDGLAMDEKGRIWVAHYGMGAVQVVDTTGELLASIPTGITLTSNVCLLGADSLIVTGGDAEPGPGRVVKLTLEKIG